LKGRAKNLVGPSTGNIRFILSIALGLAALQEMKVSTILLGALVEPDWLGYISPNKLSRTIISFDSAHIVFHVMGGD